MKRVFPSVWFGFLGIFILTALAGARHAPPFVFIVPCVVGAFGFLIMKKLVWDLMDEVYDCGDHLLIRNRGEEDSVRLADIVNVNSSFMINPPRITLRLTAPGKFGDNVAFSPPRKLFYNPFAANPIAEDLMLRADQARRARYRSPP